jgi:hypothetical protein
MGTSVFCGQKCLQYSATLFTDVFRKHRPRQAACLTCLHCSACVLISFHSAGIFSLKVSKGKNTIHTYFVSVCVCVCVCVRARVFIYIYIYTYIYTYTYVCVCVYIYIYIYKGS